MNKLKERALEKGRQLVRKEGSYHKDVVEYQHLDGSKCRFHYAACVPMTGTKSYYLGTEHNGEMLLWLEDIKYISVNDEMIYKNPEVEDMTK